MHFSSISNILVQTGFPFLFAIKLIFAISSPLRSLQVPVILLLSGESIVCEPFLRFLTIVLSTIPLFKIGSP